MSYSIHDELQQFRNRLKTDGIEVLAFEKVGNGNMAAFKMRYRLAGDTNEREDFFWRHDLDNFEKKLVNALKKSR